MKHGKLADLKEYLDALKKNELKEEIITLYKKFSNVKGYYGVKLDDDYEFKLLVESKSVISNQFWNENKSGPTLSHRKCKEAIQEFQKVSEDPLLTAELMYFYTENSVEYVNTYGDSDDKFYHNIIKSYEEAIIYTLNNSLVDEFRDKARYITDETDNLGGYIADDMANLYLNYLATEDDYEEI